MLDSTQQAAIVAMVCGPPPEGRRHFFALAASIGNVLFLVIIVLSGTGAIVHEPCMQS